VPGPDAADGAEAPTGSPRAEAAGPAEPPSLLAQLPTTFRSPGISAAVQGVVHAAGAETARLRQAAAARRLVVGTHSEAQAQTLLERAQTSARSVAAAAEATGAEAEATFATGRERLQDGADRQQAAAGLDADQALADLDAGLEAQREGTRQAAGQVTENIERAGGAEAGRATESAETTAHEIFRGARQEKGEATGDDDVQEAVGDAVDQLASDAVGGVRANGSEFAEQSQAAARETAGQLDQSEGVLLDALEAGGSLIGSALGRGRAAALGALAHASAQQVQLLESRRGAALDALEHGASSAATALRSAGRRAADQARRAGQAAQARSRRDEEDACLAVDQGARGVVEHLSQLDEHYDLDDAAVPDVVESVRHALADGATGLDQAQEPPAAEVRTRLEEGASLFDGRVRDADQRARGSLGRLGAAAATSVSGAEEAAAARSSEIVAGARATQAEAVAGFGGTLAEGAAGAQQAWAQDASKVEAGVREQVDSGIAGHEAAQGQAMQHFQAALVGAADAAESSILEAIWEAVTDFLSGLLETAVVTTAAFAVGATLGFLAGGPLLAAALGFGAAITTGATILVGAGMESFNLRTEQMGRELPDDAPWYAVGAAALLTAVLVPLDVLRVTSIIEAIRGEPIISGPELTPEQRAYKATEGVLSLGAFVLLSRLVGRVAGAGGAAPPKSGFGGFLARVRDFFRPRPAGADVAPAAGAPPAKAPPAKATILGGPGTDVVELHRYANAAGDVRPGSFWTEWETLTRESASRMTGVPAELITQRLTVRVQRSAVDEFFRDAGSKVVPGEGAALEYQNRVAIPADAVEVTPMRSPSAGG
jgi:hypothetical protein